MWQQYCFSFSWLSLLCNAEQDAVLMFHLSNAQWRENHSLELPLITSAIHVNNWIFEACENDIIKENTNVKDS